MADRVDPDQAELEALLEAWFQKREAGEAVSPEALCEARPDLLPRLLDVLGTDAAALAEARGPDPLPDAGALQPIGDYDIISLLGAGGRGRVYLARERSLRRLVALKILRDADAGDELAQRRLVREAEIAASLEHPNIVPIYAVGRADGHAFIAMQWMPGPSLQEIDVPLEPARIAEIGAAVARGLHEAHRANVVHRDVKPANVMLDPDVPRILDFGLAYDADRTTATVETHVSGTIPYMSPEQLSNTVAAGVDHRSDIYSLGATLYYLATGAPPFGTQDPPTVIQAILTADVPRIPRLDRDLETIILRALEKRPDNRFATAAAMADDLDRYRDGRPIRSRHVGPLARTWRRARRHPRTTVAVASLTVATGIACGVLVWRQQEDARRFRAQLAMIEQDIDRGELGAAEAKMTALGERQRDAVVDSLRRRLDVNAWLDELGDILSTGGRAQAVRAMRRYVDLISESGGPGGPADRWWRSLRVIARHCLGDEEAARAALELVADGDAKRALARMLDGGPWDSSTTPADDVNERRVVAMAMMHGSASPAACWSAIEAVFQLNEADYQARLLRIWWQRVHGKLRPATESTALEEVILASCENLTIPSRPGQGRFSRAVRLIQLRAAMATGHRARMRGYLAAFERERPRDEWYPHEAVVVLDAYFASGDDEGSLEIARWAQQTFPEDWSVHLRAARQRYRAGDVEGYDAALDRARALARTDRERSMTEIVRLRLRLSRIAAGEEGARKREYAAFLRDTRALGSVVLADDVDCQADLMTLQAEALHGIGRFAAAQKRLEGALAKRPTPSALFLAFRMANDRYARVCDDPAKGRAQLKEVARTGWAYVKFRDPRGRRIATPRQRASVLDVLERYGLLD